MKGEFTEFAEENKRVGYLRAKHEINKMLKDYCEDEQADSDVLIKTLRKWLE